MTNKSKTTTANLGTFDFHLRGIDFADWVNWELENLVFYLYVLDDCEDEKWPIWRQNSTHTIRPPNWGFAWTIIIQIQFLRCKNSNRFASVESFVNDIFFTLIMQTTNIWQVIVKPLYLKRNKLVNQTSCKNNLPFKTGPSRADIFQLRSITFDDK